MPPSSGVWESWPQRPGDWLVLLPGPAHTSGCRVLLLCRGQGAWGEAGPPAAAHRSPEHRACTPVSSGAGASGSTCLGRGRPLWGRELGVESQAHARRLWLIRSTGIQ